MKDSKAVQKTQSRCSQHLGKSWQELGGGMKECGGAAGSIVGWDEGGLQEIVWGQWTAFGKLGKEEEE